MIQYQCYHKHSEYTNVRVPDSTVKMEQYAQRAVELGQKLLSSCEHGWQGNVWTTVSLAKKYGLVPLIAAEAYWVKDRSEPDKTNCHIVIAARNDKGRRALNNALSEANLTGFYVQPRLDIDLILALPKDDVIITTACIAFHKYEDVDDIIRRFYNHFGENFFLEVQAHNTQPQRELNQHLLDLHHQLGIKLIAGTDSHYIKPEDAQTRSDFLQSKGMVYPDEEGWYLDYPSAETLYKRFADQCVLSDAEIREAMENTNVFLEIEGYNSDIFDENIKMPTIYPELSQDAKNDVYRGLVMDGWNKYKHTIDPSLWGKYEEEIAKEMQVVIDTHMADYFITNYYIIKRGKENGGWLTKSGRGSAVSFFTNMLLGFTEVDRIGAKVHMYPERFMSATRILESGSLPDIDFNVAPVAPFAKAQQDVLGEDHAYPMIAYGTMQKSAAWKLYAKSQEIPFAIANAVSEQIKKYELAVKHADEDSKDDIDVYEYIAKEYHDIYDRSKDYLGLICSWSIAPCSYLLYNGSIREEVGLVRVKDNICCTMDGHTAEAGHFLKNDLLKVSVVDLIYRTFKKLGQEPPSVNDLLSMCTSDDEAWRIYAGSCTIGINQCEKAGTSARAAKYRPTNISELAAFVAAIRPGFKSMYKTFESREPFSYDVEAFDSLIQTEEMPNSFILYQEQEMAALHYAGIDMSDCYTAIKNIAKKRAEKVLAYKEMFESGLKHAILAEGKSEQEADKLTAQLWQIIEDSASYSFNASHAYCVALDSLYCAWLKAHHPLEFYETMLEVQNEKGDKDKMREIKEEAEGYFGIAFPPYRYGQDNRHIHAIHERNEIDNALSAIKGFGSTVGDALFECSNECTPHFIDILQYLDQKVIRSSILVPLIQIDYFQQFGTAKNLIRTLEAWDFLKQGNAKMIAKEKEMDPLLRACIEHYAQEEVGKVLKSYRVGDNCLRIIRAYYMALMRNYPHDDYTIEEKVEQNLEVLGYVDIATNREEDRRRLIVTDVVALGKDNVWAYRVGTKSLGSGKAARLTVKANVYKTKPVQMGNIVYASEVVQNRGGFWYLNDYSIESKQRRAL